MSITTNSWALLIGVNHYLKDKPLRGCVRDVHSFQNYLDSLQRDVRVMTLTATSPVDKESFMPIEKAENWPTAQNVVSRLKEIILKACPGDTVFIHYSGHGTRITIPEEKGGRRLLKLALVLFEPTTPYRSYFRGAHMSKAIQKMVEKGVSVTLVLDCCFSGSVHRRHYGAEATTVRATEFSFKDDIVQHDDFESPEYLDLGVHRDAHVVPQWLVNPDGYAVVTACGPHEIAEELVLDDGQRAGVLSLFMVQALNTIRKYKSELTPTSLYQHIRTRFHVEWPKQVPMHYGKQDFCVFGIHGWGSVSNSVSTFRDGEILYLSAGQVHGVQNGDEYTIHSFQTSEIGSDGAKEAQKAAVAAKVKAVYALQSELEIFTDPAVLGPIGKAKLRSQVASKSIPVHVGRLSPDLVSSMLITADADSFCKYTCDKNVNCQFRIGENAQGEYVFNDSSGNRLISVPTLPRSHPRVLQQMMKVANHLARFKFLESIENRTPDVDFESSFLITSSQFPSEDGFIEIQHGSNWGFKLQNLGDKALYVIAFDFTESWQVFNMIAAAGDGEFMVLAPKGEGGEEEIELTMNVPKYMRDLGCVSCEDVIKFFVSDKETSLNSMNLEALSLTEYRSGSRNTYGRSYWLQTTNPLSGDEFRGPIHHKWTTRSFLIRTKYKAEEDVG